MNIFKILTTAGLVGMYSQVIAGSFDDTAYQKSFDLNSIIVTQKNQITMDTIKPEQTIIDLAGHQVPVLKDGLYDRFRSNPPLSVIEKERPDIDLSWFKTIQKEKKNVGFTTYSPNFYYSNRSIT